MLVGLKHISCLYVIHMMSSHARSEPVHTVEKCLKRLIEMFEVPSISCERRGHLFVSCAAVLGITVHSAERTAPLLDIPLTDVRRFVKLL
jgi:hypothetical protein